MSAMVLLVLHAVGAWAYSMFGVGAAILSALLVAAVCILGARTWFVVPLALFVALPLAAGLWRLATSDEGWWARAVEFVPFLSGCAAPVLVLLAVYLELRRRALQAAAT
jgi:hypothetical protein